jgi:hypothetical protein
VPRSPTPALVPYRLKCQASRPCVGCAVHTAVPTFRATVEGSLSARICVAGADRRIRIATTLAVRVAGGRSFVRDGQQHNPIAGMRYIPNDRTRSIGRVSRP